MRRLENRSPERHRALSFVQQQPALPMGRLQGVPVLRLGKANAMRLVGHFVLGVIAFLGLTVIPSALLWLLGGL